MDRAGARQQSTGALVTMVTVVRSWGASIQVRKTVEIKHVLCEQWGLMQPSGFYVVVRSRGESAAGLEEGGREGRARGPVISTGARPALASRSVYP